MNPTYSFLDSFIDNLISDSLLEFYDMHPEIPRQSIHLFNKVHFNKEEIKLEPFVMHDESSFNSNNLPHPINPIVSIEEKLIESVIRDSLEQYYSLHLNESHPYIIADKNAFPHPKTSIQTKSISSAPSLLKQTSKQKVQNNIQSPAMRAEERIVDEAIKDALNQYYTNHPQQNIFIEPKNEAFPSHKKDGFPSASKTVTFPANNDNHNNQSMKKPQKTVTFPSFNSSDQSFPSFNHSENLNNEHQNEDLKRVSDNFVNNCFNDSVTEYKNRHPNIAQQQVKDGFPSLNKDAFPSAPKSEAFPSAPKTEAFPSAQKPEAFPSAPKTEAFPSAQKKEGFPSALKSEAFPSAPKTEAFPSAQKPEAFPSAPKKEGFPSAIKTEAFPSAQKPEAFPSAPKTEAFPSAQKPEAFPSAPKTEAFPSAPKTEAFPSAPKTEGFPSVSKSEAFPSAQKKEGFPSAIKTEAFPSAPKAEAFPSAQKPEAFPSAIKTEAFPSAQKKEGFPSAPKTEAFPSALKSEAFPSAPKTEAFPTHKHDMPPLPHAPTPDGFSHNNKHNSSSHSIVPIEVTIAEEAINEGLLEYYCIHPEEKPRGFGQINQTTSQKVEFNFSSNNNNEIFEKRYIEKPLHEIENDLINEVIRCALDEYKINHQEPL